LRGSLRLSRAAAGCAALRSAARAARELSRRGVVQNHHIFVFSRAARSAARGWRRARACEVEP